MNWGKIILLIMAMFMSFIIILAVMMIRSKDDALIDQDYYEKGLSFDQDYQDQQQAIKDSVLPDIRIKSNELSIVFRDSADFKLVFKRLSDAGMDKNFAGRDIKLEFNNKELIPGPWIMRLNYTINEKNYLIKREIQMQ